MSDETPRPEYPALSRFMGGYIVYLDMEANSIPEAIANYARLHIADKEQLFRDINDFTKRFSDNLDEEFAKRWGLHIEMVHPKMAFRFFDLIRAVVNDPECYKQYEDAGNVRSPRKEKRPVDTR